MKCKCKTKIKILTKQKTKKKTFINDLFADLRQWPLWVPYQIKMQNTK